MGNAKTIKNHKKFGLIGKKLDYSFSKFYFEEKFTSLKLKNHSYELIECSSVDDLQTFMSLDVFQYKGLNVTIPYKETIIPYLDVLDESAAQIKAVNTIVVKEGKLIGYNTDVYGFLSAITPFLKPDMDKALLFGTGGAAKAVAYALQQKKIQIQFVSRNPSGQNTLSYDNLNKSLLESHQLLVNCTPVGTFPDIDKALPIPYEYITKKHIVFDLVYNPPETKFLKIASKQGALSINGLKMLHEQAEKAWGVWHT